MHAAFRTTYESRQKNREKKMLNPCASTKCPTTHTVSRIRTINEVIMAEGATATFSMGSHVCGMGATVKTVGKTKIPK